MPKLHKASVRTTFIAASGQCSTAALSKAPSQCLTHVLRTLREKDNKHISLTVVRRYFVAEWYDEVSGVPNRWRRSGPDLNAVGLHMHHNSSRYPVYRGRTLYTGGIRLCLWNRKCVETVFCLKLSGSECTWVRGALVTHDGDSHTFTWRE